MPIYAYKCASCGFAKDVLRKVSDAPLTTCPSCGAETFNKQVTAAGFQLKGSGWYATDFRGGSSAPAPDASKVGDTAAEKSTDKAAEKPADKAAEPGKSDAKPAKSDAKPADGGSSTGGSKGGAPSASAAGCARH